MFRFASALALCLHLAQASAWATAFGDFHNRVAASNLKPFALDLGGLLGGAAFHSGRALGFPGFDACLVGTIQSRPDREDTLLRDAGVRRFSLPLIQLELGLPRRFDLIAHGLTSQGAGVLGGGVRYGVHRTGMLSIFPDVAVSAFADKVNYSAFSAVHYSINAAASFNLPVVHPYVGTGLDVTRVTVGNASTPGLAGTSATARGSRFTGGLDASFLPFAHFYLAYTLLHGLPGLDAGIGVRF